jgi:hypothetical protein
LFVAYLFNITKLVGSVKQLIRFLFQAFFQPFIPGHSAIANGRPANFGFFKLFRGESFCTVSTPPTVGAVFVAVFVGVSASAMGARLGHGL